MSYEEIILPKDDKALKETKENINVYISRNGKGFLDEEAARYDGATHIPCECGKPAKKGWIRCTDCREEKELTRYQKLPFKEWDGVSMLFDEHSGRYFNDPDEVFEHYELEEFELDNMKLRTCYRESINTINIDDLNDEYSDEDGNGVSHYHPYIAQKVNELNELIESTDGKLWYPDRFRTNI